MFSKEDRRGVGEFSEEIEFQYGSRQERIKLRGLIPKVIPLKLFLDNS